MPEVFFSGTTHPKVYKIFGPGNQYVTAAKQMVQQMGVSIDMPAGPSEVCVMADETANPGFVAADLLSQAEHGTDSMVVLVATNADVVEMVKKEIAIQLANVCRSAYRHSTGHPAVWHSNIIAQKPPASFEAAGYSIAYCERKQ